MNLVKTLVKFVTDPKPVSTLAALEPGRAILEGVAREGDDGTLISPVKSLPCLGYYYQAYCVIGNRSGQMQPQKLTTKEVYHSFVVELPDGRVHAVPKKTDEWTPEHHRSMAASGHQNFRAMEEVFSLGTRVKVFGVAKRDGDEWTLTYHKIERINVQNEPVAKKKKKKKVKAK
jgi:hypothetical protein